MARILLVDDERLARALYKDFLTRARHEVEVAASHAEAVSYLGQSSFDVVVTDLILPAGNGMELMQFIKEKHPGTEIIVLTALDKVDPAVRAIKSGASEYLVKPVAPEALTHAVSRALTTRLLLRENAELRRHVEWLETGQRVATTLDREKLQQAVTAAFHHLANAQGVLLWTHTPSGDLKHEATSGFDDVEDSTLLSSLEAQCQSLVAQPLPLKIKPFRVEVDTTGTSFSYVYLQPAIEGQDILGIAALLCGTELEPTYSDAASYLGRHWGLALRNVGRLAEVEDLAYLDGLTQLHNSRYLELVLEREAQSSLRTQTPFSLLFADLDFFKTVNDTHGHTVGSQVLVEVAKVIKKCVRDKDVVCRWGGDEYVLLLRGTDSGGALKVAERIRRSIESHEFLAREGLRLAVTTCIGVASFPEHANDVKTLFEFADRAMYRGKKGTRNIIYLASKDMESASVLRHASMPKTSSML